MSVLTNHAWGRMAWQHSLADAISAPMIRPILDSLLRFTTGSNSYLEVGCFTAGVSYHLARLGKQTSVLDASDEVLSWIRDNFASVRLERVYCRDLNEPDWTSGVAPHDVVWNSGVLEYFAPHETARLIRDMAKLALRSVVVIVPNRRSTLYRIGKAYLEQSGRWEWGYERPITTLVPEMQAAGLTSIRETTICMDQAVRFAEHVPGFQESELGSLLRDFVEERQKEGASEGYLLFSAGRVGTTIVEPLAASARTGRF